MKTTSDIDAKLVHDVKSPITALKTEISLLIKYSGTLPRAKIREYLEKADKKTSELNDSLNNYFLLDSLQKDRFKFLYEFIELDDFLKSISDSIGKKLKKKIFLKTPVDKTILTDRELLTTALSLLLSNTNKPRINVLSVNTKYGVRMILECGDIKDNVIEYFLPVLIIEKLGGNIKFGRDIEIELRDKPKRITP